MVLHLRQAHRVDLALGHHDHATAAGEAVLPEQDDLCGVSEDAELLVRRADLLGDHLAAGVAVLGDLNGVAVVLPDPVVPQPAGLLGQTAALKGRVLHLDHSAERCRLLGFHLNHAFTPLVMLTTKAVPMPIRVPRKVVARPALRTWLMPDERRFTLLHGR